MEMDVNGKVRKPSSEIRDRIFKFGNLSPMIRAFIFKFEDASSKIQARSCIHPIILPPQTEDPYKFYSGFLSFYRDTVFLVSSYLLLYIPTPNPLKEMSSTLPLDFTHEHVLF